MKLYGKAEDVIRDIIEQFKNPEALPGMLADVFINFSNGAKPSDKWSFRNRFLAAKRGTADARGFKQWKEAGRRVKKGSKSFPIFAPCTRKVKDEDGEEKVIVWGYKTINVFAIEDTEITDPELWESTNKEIAEAEKANHEFIRNLPLIEVAQAWGVEVKGVARKGAKGFYRHDGFIGLGVKNLSTWTHELCHAADHRNETLTIGAGQKIDNEIVAELGSAALLSMLGFEYESDLGGCFDYCNFYAAVAGVELSEVCISLLGRICDVLKLIIDEAEKIGVQIQTAPEVDLLDECSAVYSDLPLFNVA